MRPRSLWLVLWLLTLGTMTASAASPAKPRKPDGKAPIGDILETFQVSRDTNNFLIYRTVFRPIEQTEANYSFEERKLTGAGKVSVVSFSPKSAKLTGYRLTEAETTLFFQSLKDAGAFSLPVRWTKLNDPLLRQYPVQPPSTKNFDSAPGYELELQLDGRRILVAFPVYDRVVYPPSSAARVVNLIEKFFDQAEEREAKERLLQDVYQNATYRTKPTVKDLPAIRTGLASTELTNRIASAVRLSLVAGLTNVVLECSELLKDSDPRIRLAAEEGLAKTGTNAFFATSSLCDLLVNHESDSIRLIAARVLRYADSQNPQLREALLKGVDDPNDKVQEVAASDLKLHKLQTAGQWEKWENLLTSLRHNTNANVLKILPINWTNEVPQGLQTKILGDLLNLAVNAQENMRLLSVQRLDFLVAGHVEVRQVLEERARKDAAVAVRLAALWCLNYRIHDLQVLEPVLLELSADPVDKIKASALGMLTQRSAGKVLTDDFLRKAMASSDRDVRANAAWMLVCRKRPEALPVLLDDLDENREPEETARHLAQFGNGLMSLIRPRLSDLKPASLRAIFSALASANMKEAGPDMLAATRHPAAEVRVQAIRSLVWLGLDDTDVRAACEILKADSEQSVQNEAMKAVEAMDRLKAQRK